MRVDLWKFKLVALIALLSCAFAWAQSSRVDAAKSLFAQFVEMEQAYDPAIADLYAPEALVTIRRTFPMGNPNDTIFPASDYKKLLRELMPAAKANADRNRYSKVTFTPEGDLVRIQAARYSEIKGRTSPISLLAGHSPGGKWLIYEELSESRQ